MRRIAITPKSRDKMLHVEVPGCIVNIHTGLTDSEGRKMTYVEIMADGDRYAGELPWWIEGQKKDAHHKVRVIQVPKPAPVFSFRIEFEYVTAKGSRRFRSQDITATDYNTAYAEGKRRCERSHPGNAVKGARLIGRPLQLEG